MVAALATIWPAAASAAAPSDRTTRVSGGTTTSANGASTQPALTSDGNLVAYVSDATNLLGARVVSVVPQLYVADRAGRGSLLVSASPLGEPGDGPAATPSISGSGGTIAWASTAGNLVPDDTNAMGDVFVRRGRGPVEMVSQPLDGGQANAASFGPAVSRDGRFVAFVSTADNLVADDANGVAADIYVRDLALGTLRRVSDAADGSYSDGDSTAPSINANGTVVSFTSAGSNLVPNDTNGVADVFVRDLVASLTRRVSVASGGAQQNRSVSGGFPQISSLSADGRYVAFDSDATNLIRGDVNNDTDVFVHDRANSTTGMASLSSSNAQGNSDSFFPTLSDNGRYVAFQSYSTGLAPGHGPGADVMLRDLGLQTTSVADVPAAGGLRAPEPGRQLLQRPTLSADGLLVGFATSAANLVPGDSNRLADVFVRRMSVPPLMRVRRLGGNRRPVFRLSSSDTGATAPVCSIDGAVPEVCRVGRWSPRRAVPPGRHRLRVRAGGPGLAYPTSTRTVTFTVRR